MGYRTWDTDEYDHEKRRRRETHTPEFAYEETARSTGDYRVHPDLDPKNATVRESRDSTEHPNSTAVSVLIDVTGSMVDNPKKIKDNLPNLMDVLLRETYISHPQIMTGAIGDATCDYAPLQISQWESDVRIDEHLGKLLLEGNGGRYGRESYELAMYFMARRTVMDCWERWRRKGYLIIIGDEMAYPFVKSDEVRKIIGDQLESDIPIRQIVKELQQRFHVFFLIPSGASGSDNHEVFRFWTDLLGSQYVQKLQDSRAICETIALLIGLNEGATDLERGARALKDAGASASAIAAATTALATFESGSSLAKPSGPGLGGLAKTDKGRGTERLGNMCENCGDDLPEGAKHCISCGAPVSYTGKTHRL